MDIILNVDPGPELVRLINQLGQEVEGVDQVVVDAFVPELSKDHSIGAFEPTTKTIIIDIGHCLTDYRWMKYGALFITNVWLNMVIAVFHEFAHADQLASGDVTIEEMDQDKDIHTLFEDDAVTKAMQEAYTYFSDGGIVPPLRELGWVGEHIAQTFNNTYNEIPEQIMEEIEAHKVGAAVDMKTAMAALPRFNEENMRLAYENVDNKQGGVKLDGKYYMTMGEFIASTKERTTYTK